VIGIGNLPTLSNCYFYNNKATKKDSENPSQDPIDDVGNDVYSYQQNIAYVSISDSCSNSESPQIYFDSSRSGISFTDKCPEDKENSPFDLSYLIGISQFPLFCHESVDGDMCNLLDHFDGPCDWVNNPDYHHDDNDDGDEEESFTQESNSNHLLHNNNNKYMKRRVKNEENSEGSDENCVEDSEDCVLINEKICIKIVEEKDGGCVCGASAGSSFLVSLLLFLSFFVSSL
jgi:hypothetical protein